MSRPSRAKVQRCGKCGCTELQACPGGCHWVAPDLCSACVKTADVDDIERGIGELVTLHASTADECIRIGRADLAELHTSAVTLLGHFAKLHRAALQSTVHVSASLEVMEDSARHEVFRVIQAGTPEFTPPAAHVLVDDSLSAALALCRQHGWQSTADAFERIVKGLLAAPAQQAAEPEGVQDAAFVKLEEVACDLHYLLGRASRDGHEVGQRLATEVQEKMRKALAALSRQPAPTPVADTNDGLDFEPDEQHTVADMANVGYSLMQAIRENMPGYAWSNSPAEIVVDLICELDAALASRAPAKVGEQGGASDVRGDGLLPEALIPHATEWYALCERRFAVERIAISGDLACAIVQAIIDADSAPANADTASREAAVTPRPRLLEVASLPEDALDRLLMGRANESDQFLARNAIVALRELASLNQARPNLPGMEVTVATLREIYEGVLLDRNNDPHGDAKLLALIQAIEALDDAKRYRLLREYHWNDSPYAVVSSPATTVRPGTNCPSHDRLDAVLDAALGLSRPSTETATHPVAGMTSDPR